MSGLYTLTVTHSSGCSATATTNVIVNPTSVAGSISGATSVCPGTNTTTLTLSGNTGAIQWQGSTDNTNFNNISGETSSALSVVNLNVTGYYRAIVKSGICSAATSTSVAMIVKTNVAITNITAPSNFVCPGGQQTLTANGVTGDNAILNWWTGSGGSGTNLGNTPTITVGDGTYYARVTGDCGTPVQTQYTIFTKVQPAYISTMTIGGTSCVGAVFTAFGQVFIAGTTEGTGVQGADVIAEFGYSTANTNPSTWTTWVAATFNAAGGGTNNDEYSYDFTVPSSGTIYFAFRYRRTNCDSFYGGYSSTGGGTWNNTSNVSGVINAISETVAGTSAPLSTNICAGTLLSNNITVTGQTGSIVKWQKSTNPTFATFTDITNTTTSLSALEIGVVNATTYVRAVIQSGSCSVVNSIAAILTVKGETFNGTGNWTNGTIGTTINESAIINANYNTTADGVLHACSIIVNAPFTLTVTAGQYMNIINGLTVASGATVTIENNASLVQFNNTAVNTGSITYKRDAIVKKFDYVYWSSPVVGFSSASVFPATDNSRRFFWNPTLSNVNGSTGNWVSTSETMQTGKGYIIQAPGTLTPVLPATVTLTTTFVGVPHNGIIEYTIARGTNVPAGTTTTTGVVLTVDSDNNNLIGNPYPSAINANDFLVANPNIQGAVSLWTHGTSPNSAAAQPFYGSFANNYSSSDYITYNKFATNSDPIGFNGQIAAGQAFFVKMIDGATSATATVTFDNSLRSVNHSNNQFYRTANNVQTNSIEKHRIWLDLTQSANNNNTRIVVGYAATATNGYDRLFDATSGYSASQSFFSNIDDGIYSIQARALPFVDTDIIPLGFSVSVAGVYSIGIHAADGLFANNGQTIYLQDNLTGTVHNLSASPYGFVSTVGANKTRFALRYTAGTLSNNAVDLAKNSVLIFKDNATLKVLSPSENILSVSVYDILGRNVFAKNNIMSNSFSIENVVLQQQTLIVKATLTNGSVVTKKIVY